MCIKKCCGSWTESKAKDGRRMVALRGVLPPVALLPSTATADSQSKNDSGFPGKKAWGGCLCERGLAIIAAQEWQSSPSFHLALPKVAFVACQPDTADQNVGRHSPQLQLAADRDGRRRGWGGRGRGVQGEGKRGDSKSLSVPLNYSNC